MKTNPTTKSNTLHDQLFLAKETYIKANVRGVQNQDPWPLFLKDHESLLCLSFTWRIAEII